MNDFCGSIVMGGAPSPAPTAREGLILDAEVVEAIAATTTAAVYGSNTHQKHTQCAISLCLYLAPAWLSERMIR